MVKVRAHSSRQRLRLRRRRATLTEAMQLELWSWRGRRCAARVERWVAQTMAAEALSLSLSPLSTHAVYD